MSEAENPTSCAECDGVVPARRAALGYTICLACGERAARSARATWAVAPAGHKQGYTRITNRADLRQMNPKRSEGW